MQKSASSSRPCTPTIGSTSLTQVSGSDVPFHPLLPRARSDNDDVLRSCPREKHLLGLCVESRRDLVQRFVQGSPGQARNGKEWAVALAHDPMLVAELDQSLLLMEVVRVYLDLYCPIVSAGIDMIGMEPTFLVRSRDHLGRVEEDLEMFDLEVAHAYTLGEPLGLEFLHDRPSSRDVRLGDAGSVDEVQVNIFYTQLRSWRATVRSTTCSTPVCGIRTFFKLACIASSMVRLSRPENLVVM